MDQGYLCNMLCNTIRRRRNVENVIPSPSLDNFSEVLNVFHPNSYIYIASLIPDTIKPVTWRQAGNRIIAGKRRSTQGVTEELQIDREKDRMDLFSRLWHSLHSASLPCSGSTGGPSSAQPGACSICLRVDGTCRGGVFEIPCIPATEHKCPGPDINQLFQVRREGFGLRATLSSATMFILRRGYKTRA